jgi:hypothetical protein
VESIKEIPTLIFEGPLDQISKNDIKSRLESEFGCHVSKVTIDRNRMRAVVEFGSEEDLKNIISSNTQNEIRVRGKTVRIGVILYNRFSYYSLFLFDLLYNDSYFLFDDKVEIVVTINK